MDYSFRLAARVLLYASSHRQDSTYHGLCYTSRGALAGTRNSSMGPPHEGSIRRPIAPWANALTTELHLAPHTIERSYHRATSRSPHNWTLYHRATSRSHSNWDDHEMVRLSMSSSVNSLVCSELLSSINKISSSVPKRFLATSNWSQLLQQSSVNITDSYY